MSESEVTTNNCPERLVRLMHDAHARRLWILYHALLCLPLDRAVELACAAENFITGSPVGRSADNTRRTIESAVADGTERIEQLANGVSRKGPVAVKPAKMRIGATLSTERRDKVLDCLAKGARNAELAGRYGLSPKQVQGLRMGCAREIAERRNRLGTEALIPVATDPVSGSVEDVVRYLRQQDDIVVRQERGDFLVNGRFVMPVNDLIARANRMRARLHKPSFELAA